MVSAKEARDVRPFPLLPWDCRQVGGWLERPQGRAGGKTMYCITEAVYHARLKGRGLNVAPVRSTSLSDAKLTYRGQY